MVRASSSNFRVGPWVVRPGLNVIERDDQRVVLEPRIMDLLVYLAEHPSRTVAKEELLREVWGGAFVSEGVVTKSVSALRSALEDDARRPRYLATVPRRGYRLIAPVERVAGGRSPPAESRSPSAPRGWLLWIPLALLVAAISVAVAFRHGPKGPRPRASGSIDRVAVLPFRGEPSLPPELQHLPASLRDEVTHRLAAFARPRSILVPEGESSRRSRDEIAAETGADAFLEGTVGIHRRHLEVRVVLLAAPDQELLWSRRWRRPLSGDPGLDREIAASVVEETRRELDELERRRLLAGVAVDPEAHRAYLQARWLWSRRGIEDMNRAATLFQEAITLDPTFADAFAGLAMCEITRGSYRILPHRTAWARAERAARRSLVLDPGNAEALTAIGLVTLQRDWDFETAIRSYREALRASPGLTSARQLLAEALSIVDRHEEAERAIEHALELEPYSPLLMAVRGLVRWAAGQPEEALASLDEAVTFDPRFSWVHRYRAYALLDLGRQDEAARARWEEARARGVSEERLESLERAIEDEGYGGALLWTLEQVEERSQPVSGDAWERVESLAGLGRTEEALAWLEPAVDERGEYLLHRRRTASLDAIRSHPRYVTLLAEHGISP